MRVKRDPATGEIHHVEARAPGYGGWDDLGAVPQGYSPYTHRFDDTAGAYVKDIALAEQRLRQVRAEYKRLTDAIELGLLANLPTDVVEEILAKRRANIETEEESARRHGGNGGGSPA